MRSTLGMLVCFLMLLAPAAAEDPPAEAPTPAQAAEAALAALKADDKAALADLAGLVDPDPWIVADELLRRGEHAAALAFAGAAPRPDTASLPAYVTSRQGKPDDAARRERILRANRAFDEDRPADALAALQALEGEPADDVLAVRMAMGRALALAALRRAPEAEDAFAATAQAAERMGWLARAYEAHDARALSAFERSDLDPALASWERAGDLALKRQDSYAQGETLVMQGAVHKRKGQHAQALTCYDRAYRVHAENGQDAEAAAVLINIGGLYEATGDYPKAIEVLQRGIDAAHAASQPGCVADGLDVLGLVHARRGDYAQALATLERALAEQEALGDARGAARALSKLGMVYDLLADYPKSLEVAQRTLALQERLSDPGSRATALSQLAIAWYRLEDYAQAIAFNEQALAAFEALGDRSSVIAVSINLGVAHESAGQPAAARVHFERGLEAAEAISAKQWTAVALDNLGSVHAALEDRARAIEFRRRALRVREELGDRAGLALTLMALAKECYLTGDWVASVQAARQGAQIAPAVVSGLGDEQGATARAQLAGLFTFGAQAAAEARDAASVWDLMERGRAGSLLEALGARDKLQAALVPPALVAAEAEARAREASASVAFRQALEGSDRKETRARREALEQARSAVADVVQRVQREAKAAADIVHFAPDDPDTARKRLAPEEALVLYGLGGENALAFVATPDGASTVKLGLTADIEAACEALLGALRTRAGDEAERQAAERLRDLVITPLGLSPATRRLLISPDAGLAYVPFVLLAPDRELAYVPSGTTYGLLLQDRPVRGTGVLALGDPDYQTRRADPAPESLQRGAPGRLARLPATALEAKAIGGSVLLGGDATEGRLRAKVGEQPRWRAIHFACHGIIDAEHPGFSSLALTTEGEDDGFLTVLEVFRSRFPADLVVLSACETAKGKDVQGEGVMGLTRAFMFAGSPRVICSLWKVDDEATQALMVKFYELWNPKEGTGLPTAQALKQAQAFVRSQERWKHPYYWAAWVLWGLPD